MAEEGSSLVSCHNCDAQVAIESAIKLIVERGDRQVWTVLCQDCSVVGCPSCGQSIAMTAFLEDREDHWTSRQLIQCDRCDERVPANDAVELRRKENPQYRKRLCGRCFEETPAPPGFTVIRDFAGG